MTLRLYHSDRLQIPHLAALSEKVARFLKEEVQALGIDPPESTRSITGNDKGEGKDRLSYRLYGVFGFAAGAGEGEYGISLCFNAGKEYRAGSNFVGTINHCQE